MHTFPQINTKHVLNIAVSEFASNCINRVQFSSVDEIKLLAIACLQKMANCPSDKVIENLRSLSSMCTMEGEAKESLTTQVNLIIHLAANIAICLEPGERGDALEAVGSSIMQNAIRWLALDDDGLKQHFAESILSHKLKCFEQFSYNNYTSSDEYALAKKIRYHGLQNQRNYNHTIPEDTKILSALFERDASAVNKFPSIFLSNKSIVLLVIHRAQSAKISKFTSEFNLAKLSAPLRDDPEIFYACNKHRHTAKNVQFASDALKSDRVFFTRLVALRGSALHFAASNLRNQVDLVMKAVQNDPGSIVFASGELQSSAYMMLKMVEAHHVTKNRALTEIEK